LVKKEQAQSDSFADKTSKIIAVYLVIMIIKRWQTVLCDRLQCNSINILELFCFHSNQAAIQSVSTSEHSPKTLF